MTNILRAHARTAESTRKIDRQLARVDSSSAIAVLEKMKDKAEEKGAQRALARIAKSARKVDKQLAGVDSSSAITVLEKMKGKAKKEEPPA